MVCLSCVLFIIFAVPKPNKMKRIAITVTALTVLITLAVIACNSNKEKSNAGEGIGHPQALSEDSLKIRGKYLVTIMVCNDCHTPKKMGPFGPEEDTALLLSGHPSNMPLPQIDNKALQSWVLFNHQTTAMVGPWGTSYAANLTSDSSGIGSWSEKQFFTAIRKGKYKGLESGRTLLPPMPWTSYAHASDEDLRAIFVYLKSTRPVKNVVPAPIPPNQLSAK